MDDSDKQIKVKIAAFGTVYSVKTAPENEERIKRAANLLESKSEEISNVLKKKVATTDRPPEQFFYAALQIADEMLMLREDSEQKLAGIEKVVDDSLIAKFIKLKMAYGAERQ
ncbi:cell division protein ZapA [Candidatus Mycalebacterium sp.]